MKEAGIEWTRAGELAADREQWSSKVKERMQQLEEWERGKGNENRNDPPMERNPGWEETNPLRCRWEGCGKICKSKGGLAIHIRRMHDEAKANLKFKCGACGIKFKSENTMINHQKVCGGEPRQGGRREGVRGAMENFQRRTSFDIGVLATLGRVMAAREGTCGLKNSPRHEYTSNTVRSVAGCFPPQTWPDIVGAAEVGDLEEGRAHVWASVLSSQVKSELPNPLRIPCTSCSTHRDVLSTKGGGIFRFATTQDKLAPPPELVLSIPDPEAVLSETPHSMPLTTSPLKPRH